MGTGRPVWGIVTNMTTASALDTARRIAAPVGMLGGGFMLDPSVLGAGKEAGYPNGFVYYVVGRGGVLGDVHADVVVSAFGFFAPDLVSKMWNAQVEAPRAAADLRRRRVRRARKERGQCHARLARRALLPRGPQGLSGLPQ